MLTVSNTHFPFAHYHHQRPKPVPTTELPHHPNHPPTMSTIPSHQPKPPSSVNATSPSTSAKAEYEAALTAHKVKLAELTPAREAYDELYAQHTKIQEHLDKIGARIDPQRSIYLRHKQYVASLSNALLASNTTLQSVSQPWSHVQVLTQATLVHKLRDAGRTLVNIIVQNKRLDEMKMALCKLDQESYRRCNGLFHRVHKDCCDLDKLHADVVRAEKKMGRERECGLMNSYCDSCDRNQDQEARKGVAEKRLSEVKERVRRKARGRPGRVTDGKKSLDDILEEEEVEDGTET